MHERQNYKFEMRFLQLSGNNYNTSTEVDMPVRNGPKQGSYKKFIIQSIFFFPDLETRCLNVAVNSLPDENSRTRCKHGPKLL